jgi:hypothetical protein
MISVRLLLAVAGLAAALLAVWSGDRRIGWVAIALLLSYLIVRVVQRSRDRGHRNDES